MLFLLFYRDCERPRAGLWVALGAMVKPYFVFFLAYLLLKRAYRTLAMATLCLASAGTSTVIVRSFTDALVSSGEPLGARSAVHLR